VALLRLLIVIQALLRSLCTLLSVDSVQALRQRIVIDEILIISFGVRVARHFFIEHNLARVFNLNISLKLTATLPLGVF
jgi:hypothetical protein